ncbi:MAG: hypothetical protein B7Z55_07650 [Planctomycetales bacterium 12-60-4]|nr:MAG: hypothetical protein B7Z55_07650 [Planctomycetales bacterium 12-60-4]
MNCDEAFDALTDLQRADSSALAEHLAGCPRCRQMRETLSPALEWLHTDADKFGSDVSWSSGSATSPLLTAQALRIAEQVSRDLPRRRSSGARLRQLVTIAAVAIAGIAVGALGIDGGHDQPSSPTIGDETMLTACLWTTPGLRDGLPDASARGVVVSCVMCHVPTSLE